MDGRQVSEQVEAQLTDKTRTLHVPRYLSSHQSHQRTSLFCDSVNQLLPTPFIFCLYTSVPSP